MNEATHRAAGSGNRGDANDALLLRDYLARGDARAFAALVQRHSPLVWGVCRRLLDHEQDAEDALQATFVVLMGRARSLTRPHLLGNWLYGVAYRVASKIRSANARKRAREVPMADPPAPEADDELLRGELRSVLDDELQQLPRRYRRPLVLFYLEGRSAEDVASILGCPKGTILSQLARGRERLRGRLLRRGITLSAGLLAGFLSGVTSTEAALPQTILDWSLRLQSGSALAEAIQQGMSTQAKLVSQQVVKEMLTLKLQVIGAIVVTGLLSVGIGMVAYRNFAGAPVPVPKAISRSEADELQGTWEVATVSYAGALLPRGRFPFTRLRIRGDTIIQEGADGTLKMSFRLDSGRDPKTMDMKTDGFHHETYYALYDLNGDTLRICRRELEQDRPQALVSPPNTGIFLITAKRSKP